ncbi:MAG: aminotransferase class V-fold PLP-dependent enzyme [Gemmatimonadetes bacterium]|nr:aminotransferase class V-fold PLP-dependent enzyme [Gemmatimonadota bacterium]
MSPAEASARCGQARAAEYPQLEAGRIFLNAASYGPLPASSLAALAEYQARRAAARLGPDDFGAVLPAARAEAARLVGADPDEIALVPNTNVGVNIAASIARQRHQDRDFRHTIVVSAGEFPANVYPWLALEPLGMRVRILPTDELGRPREDALFRALEDDDVAVLALSAVQFASGWRAPIERLGELCRARDILFAIDGIQAAGVIPVDVRAAHIDVFATGAQKWLCSPFATGFAYVRRDFCRAYEPEQPGWLSFGAAADFNRLCSYDYDLYEDARRFEVGTLAYPEFIAMSGALRLINDIGVAAVWQHVRALLQPLLDWARSRDDVMVTSATGEAHRSGILCLRPRDVAGTYEALAGAHVTCALREGAIRLAPHFYNTAAEIAAVLEILDRCR